MIVTPEIEEYLQFLTPLDHALLQEMEQLAIVDRIPIIDRASIHMIRSVLRYKGNVHAILEIGTAIGYSTIWLAEAAPKAHVDTIERDETRYRQAQAFIERAELQNRIHLHLADATAYALELERAYDVIFIDAAKGQYQLFFEAYAKLLRPGGLIITDNVFFHGEVTSTEIENKRIRSLVKKIKGYNEWLRDHPDFETSFIPIGDGLSFSIKREHTS